MTTKKQTQLLAEGKTQTLKKLVNQASDGDAQAAESLKQITTSWDKWQAALEKRTSINKATNDMLAAANQNFANIMEEGVHFSAGDGTRLDKLVRCEKSWQDRTETIAQVKDLRHDVKSAVEDADRRLRVAFEDVNQLSLAL